MWPKMAREGTHPDKGIPYSKPTETDGEEKSANEEKTVASIQPPVVLQHGPCGLYVHRLLEPEQSNSEL